MKKPISLYLITSSACNVKCKTCPAPREDTDRSGIMSVEMLKKIMAKVTKEARVYYCQLFLYNEPLLIPWVGEMIATVHSFGVPVFMSSNLVIGKHIASVMAAAPETLLISVSGWTQDIYERSHKGGDIEAVKANMKEVARLRTCKTHVQVSWHRYRYNEHEEDLMRNYAESLGFTFVPYTTSLLPHTAAMKVWATGIDDPNGSDCIIPVRWAKEMCGQRKHWPCWLQAQALAINANGDYSNCAQRADSFNILGSIFTTTIGAILEARKKSSMCASCKSVGAHIYAQQHYSRNEWSPFRIAENVYRGLGLSGLFPKFSLWATHNLYVRPQKKTTI